MAVLPIVFLTAQGFAFLIWIVLAFRFLFALRADAVAMSGHSFPDVRTQLMAFRGGLERPRYHGQRQALAVLTILLLALAAVSKLIV